MWSGSKLLARVNGILSHNTILVLLYSTAGYCRAVFTSSGETITIFEVSIKARAYYAFVSIFPDENPQDITNECVSVSDISFLFCFSLQPERGNACVVHGCGGVAFPPRPHL